MADSISACAEAIVEVDGSRSCPKSGGGIVDFPWALGFRRLSQGVASLMGLSPDIAGKSWRGASLRVKEVRETIEDAGATVQELTGEDTPMTWCSGLKSRTKPQ